MIKNEKQIAKKNSVKVKALFFDGHKTKRTGKYYPISKRKNIALLLQNWNRNMLGMLLIHKSDSNTVAHSIIPFFRNPISTNLIY